MRYRALGKTGLTVSEVGFGGWAIDGRAFGPVDEAVALAALNRAYELGCTFFSTADSYGRSEALLGQALKGWRRNEVVISTKGGQGGGRLNFSAPALRQAVEASLQTLGIETIDLYQLHNPTLELIQLGHMFDVLRALQQEGKIRHIGITIHDPQEGVQALDKGDVASVETVFNLFDRRAEKALPDACQSNGAGLILREPLARGFLSGAMAEDVVFEPGDTRAVWPRPLIAKRVQAANTYKQVIPENYPDLTVLALRFCLDQAGVSCVLPDLKTPDEVERAMQTPNLPPLDAETRQRIDTAGRAIF